MPYPERMVRVAITAALQDGESMVHTFHVKDVRSDFSQRPDLQELATGLRDKWQAQLYKSNANATVAGFLSPSTAYRKVTAYEIDPATGRARDLAESSFPSIVVGSSSGTWPTEIALCATIQTGFPGRTRRGRLYLGGLGSNVAVGGTGRVLPGVAATCSTMLAGFFRDVRNIGVGAGAQDKWEPQVVSTTTGTAAKITAVAIGDVFDVQRRRRNKISEARTSAAVG